MITKRERPIQSPFGEERLDIYGHFWISEGG